MSRRYGTAVNGILWVQGATGALESYDDDPTNPAETYSMRVRTAPIPAGAVPLAAGRCRGASVNGKNRAAHRFRIKLLADTTERPLLNTAIDAVADAAAPSTWPNDSAPEFRATVQRCHSVEVELIATPPAAEWTSIDVWVSGSDERQPSTNRG